MALYKYEVKVIEAASTKEREEQIWEIGRSGWELVSVLPGDWMTGETDAKRMTWFLRREATHDIDF